MQEHQRNCRKDLEGGRTARIFWSIDGQPSSPKARRSPRALARVSSSSKFACRVDDDSGTARNWMRNHDGQATNQDIQIEIAVVVEVAEGAGIGASLDVLQLGDNLHAADFRTAGDCSARKDRTNDVSWRRPQRASDR